MLRFPPVPDGPPVRISATAYLAFQECEAQAQARFGGAYPADSAPAFFGVLAHRIFARHLVSGPIDDMAQAVREEIGSGLNAKMAAVGINRPSQLATTIRRLGPLYDRFRRLSEEGFMAAEVPLEVEPVKDVVLIGKVDALFHEGNPAPLLRDWKTGPLADPLKQLLYYAYLWAWKRAVVPTVEAISLQTGEQLRKVPTQADLREVGERLAALVTAIRQTWAETPAPRRAGPWCRFCPIMSNCPEGKVAAAVANL
ncbi:MAG TPA: PD-(D/E)XK nuclease family protein [Acidimicrobiia bacterium]|nr:PD-(D/E)XK nuclease family protein [Acidimicrobiia bacterium]